MKNSTVNRGIKSRVKKCRRNVEVEFKGIASNRTYHVYDRLTADCINLMLN